MFNEKSKASRRSSDKRLVPMTLFKPAVIFFSTLALITSAKLVDADLITSQPAASQSNTTLTAPVREALVLTSKGVEAPKSNLRCWQEGVLLFEETGLREQVSRQADEVLVFEREAQNKGAEILLIQSGSATCLYKKV